MGGASEGSGGSVGRDDAAGVREFVTLAVNMEEMPTPDSTKDLINANHHAVLRELDGVKVLIRDGLSDVRRDSANVRDELDEHNAQDAAQFSAIASSLTVLKWGYALGAVIFSSALVMVLKMLMGG